MAPRRQRQLPSLSGLATGILALATGFAGASQAPFAQSGDTQGPITKIHKAGYCALRGEASKSFFGAKLPIPYNGPAQEPDAKTRESLVKLCGSQWTEGPVCCDADQVSTLAANVKKAENLIASCPACKANFFNLFCEFTCSPDQSLFVNVTVTEPASGGKEVVEELDYLVAPTYGEGFYDSCKDVKFAASGSNVMDLIGGGAKNYTDFLKFLGKKSPFMGSPFQINFPPKKDHDKTMKAMNDRPKKCNDEDVAYRCACLDCPAVCPILPGIGEQKHCFVGPLPCWSFSVIIVYSVFLAIGGSWLVYWLFQQHRAKKHARLRILQDVPSDDEGNSIVNMRYAERPQREYRLNTILDNVFYHIGYYCAAFPGTTILISLLVVGFLSLGWTNFQVETDPVRLWVSPTSDAAMEKQFFDDNFGPFYRTQQAFLMNDTSGTPEPVLSYETLGWWFDVEQRIRRMQSYQEHLTLADVCLKPTGEGCVVQSVTSYFGGDFRNVKLDSWKQQLQQCTDQPTSCLPDFGQPIKKEMVLGGLKDSTDVTQAKALLVTWVLENHAEGSEAVKRSMDYEQTLKNMLLMVKEEAKERGLRLSFSTEISLEEELNKSTNTDAKIVVISYIAMFFYASIALGSSTKVIKSLFHRPSSLLVESKFTLGVFGILIVLMSVSASVGLFSAMNIKVTLIIAEVIPFLVLAVGVDNIFLIVHEFERADQEHPDERIEDKIGNAMGRMGPSILLSATSETIAFGLGAAVAMPAVRNFAIYAAGAVFINAVLQVTMFIAVLALNQRRVEDNRIDCFPCLKAPTHGEGEEGVGLLGNGHRGVPGFGTEEEGLLQRIIRKRYAPFLLQTKTKIAVVTVFLGIFAASLALFPAVELGLDQRIAIPRGSYLVDYFTDLYDYFAVGPPLYFVTKGLNGTSRTAQQSLCGRFSTCDPLSLSNLVEQERKRPEYSYIAESAASWIDDMFLWLNPSLDQCCLVKKNDPNQLCTGPFARGCETCFAHRENAWNITLDSMPEGEEFMHYLHLWQNAPTGPDCPIAGKAAYSSAIVTDDTHLTTPATHFRTSHTHLNGQQDFIDAYAAARRIAKDISKTTKTEVFPYSKFYIFFDQYSTIVRLTAGLIAAALLSTIITTSLLLGSLKTGLVVGTVVAMIITDIVAVMALWNVSLNAVSLVNLVICVGISVEFCSHIARAFMFPPISTSLTPSPSGSSSVAASSYANSRNARAYAALVSVGSSVFSGITVTKIIGVTVLAWTKSRIFEIYYFRVWVALVAMASTHALVLLPVLLSWMGGEGWDTEVVEQGLVEDLRRRRGWVGEEGEGSSDEEE
ncbi:putative patched sphingolipid transporter [Ascodesmis nigricans]|uniref:Putative patched sphingolipid transporter n=1 Tax=Ascodesmis nigricans TaxID=341454 RepID=A0A4S2MM84_9PEZI|nr:putative patched sphingolipid transporter [Ascodesmis nigricans]